MRVSRVSLSLLCSLLFFILILPQPPRSTLFPYTTLFRSQPVMRRKEAVLDLAHHIIECIAILEVFRVNRKRQRLRWRRSEEHTSELQSRRELVCRLLLEKKKEPVTGDAYSRSDLAMLPAS